MKYCMKLTDEQFLRYAADPVGMDGNVRQWLSLPADCYYSVSVWPKAGVVTLNGLTRVVCAKKVSKSDA